MTRTCLRQHLKAKLYVSSIKISDKKYVQLPKKYSSPISQLMQRSCLLTHSTSPRQQRPGCWDHIYQGLW
uniref:Uncharacterized protein n=1 Tax=Anguilla anguilla TaxID=7936 RepID=A0A0E9Q5E0_ANGAN